MSRLIAEHRLPSGQVLQLVHGDLTEEQVDVIVNAANAGLQHGGGVAGTIVRRGGPVIQQESDRWVREHGPISHKTPALTGAGRLPCRHIIHAVGPVWGEGREDEKLAAAVAGALRLADRQSLSSLALPAISTGIFGFPKDRGARVLIDALLGFFDELPNSSLKQVRITLIDQPSVQVFAAEFFRRWPERTTPA